MIGESSVGSRFANISNVAWIARELREKCPNTELFLVRIQENTDQKKLRIWTLFSFTLVVWNTRVIDNISLKEYQKRIQNPAKHLTRSFSAKTNRPLFIFAKSSSLDVWLGSENNASDLRTSHEKGIILVIYEYSAQRCMTTANIWDGDLCKSSSSAETPLTICKIFHLRWSRKRWIS